MLVRLHENHVDPRRLKLRSKWSMIGEDLFLGFFPTMLAIAFLLVCLLGALALGVLEKVTSEKTTIVVGLSSIPVTIILIWLGPIEMAKTAYWFCFRNAARFRRYLSCFSL